MEHDFIVFFLNYCLDHYFKSKADMARQIDVNVCTLMRVMNPPYHFKAGSVPFQNTLWYCLTHQIEVAPIFELYTKAIGKQDESEPSCSLHEPPIWELPCIGMAMKELDKDDSIHDEHKRKLLRLYTALSNCLCQNCSRASFFTNDSDCLSIQIMQSAAKYYRLLK